MDKGGERMVKNEKIVFDPTPEREAKKAAKTKAKKKNLPGDVLEFDLPKGLNKWGFIHLPKKSWDFLPFAIGEKLHARIDPDAGTLIIRKA
jgi:hypothetical protein